MEQVDISTPDEFRRKFADLVREEANRLTLPSGLVILARRCTPLQMLILTGTLPQGLAAGLSPDTSKTLDNADIVRVARTTIDIVRRTVIEPKIAPTGTVTTRFVALAEVTTDFTDPK